VEEEIPLSCQVDIPMISMDANLEMDVDMMEETPPPTPIQLSDECPQLIFELQQKLDDQTHIQQILGKRMDLMFDDMT
jgi:hypothetical protein